MPNDLVRSNEQTAMVKHTPGVQNPFKKRNLSYCKILDQAVDKFQIGAIMFAEKKGINPRADGQPLVIPVRCFGGKPISTKFPMTDEMLRQKEYLDYAGFRLRNENPPEPIVETDEKMPICTSNDMINSSGTLIYKGQIIKKCENCPFASRFITVNERSEEKMVMRKFSYLSPSLTESQSKYIGQKRQDDFHKWYWGDGTQRYPGVKDMKMSPTCDTVFTFVVGTEKAEQLTLVSYKRTTEKTGIDLLRILEDVPIPWSLNMNLVIKTWSHEKYRPFSYAHLEVVGFDESWEQHPRRSFYDAISFNIDDYLPQYYQGDPSCDDAAKFGLPPELMDSDIPIEVVTTTPPASPPPPKQNTPPTPPPAEKAAPIPEPEFVMESSEEEVSPAPAESPAPSPAPAPAPAPAQSSAPAPPEDITKYDDMDMSELDDLTNL